LGWEWVPQLDSFVAWSRGADLFLLQPPAKGWRTQPWIWTRIEGSGEPPAPPRNGPYSKFQYVPELGIALIATSRTGPVHAIRLVEVDR
jgi:hypothetical protein